MSTILLTGTNRGIGLELVKWFDSEQWRVIACCRDPEQAGELQALSDHSANVGVYRLDVADDRQIAGLAHQLSDTAIDILFNNAGIFGPAEQGFGATDPVGWLEALRINTIAPLQMAEAFVEQVAGSRRRVIASMGSVMGSIAENGSGGYYAYRTSKAAVHMVMKGLAVDLAPRGIITAAFHPGWVRTRMGGDAAPLQPAESAAGLGQVLLAMTPAQSGKLIDYQGIEHPW